MRELRLPGLGLTAAAWGIGILVTALVVWGSFLAVGYRNPDLHLILDSVDACIALLVAYLIYGRFVRHRRLEDLLLVQGLVLLALSGVGLTPAALELSRSQPGSLEIWLPLAVRVLGGLLIAGAAVASLRRGRLSVSRRAGVAAGVLLGAVVVLIGVVLWTADLPRALNPAYVPVTSGPPFTDAHPVLIAGQIVAALSFLVASAAFTVSAARRQDELLRWLGPACALGGFARVNYALFPSLYTDWLYTGDFLRTACYLLLLVAATRELTQYWSAQTRIAVLEDRRRLARELHDGVMQELGLIRSETHALPAGTESVRRIAAACDRAMDETRLAIHALGRMGSEPLGFALHRTARELAERHRINLEIEVDDSIDADPDQKHALLRITREAVSNAVRHGGAERIWVCLRRNGEERLLRIRDDGAGFDPAAVSPSDAGYGLVSMRERARSLPGRMHVDTETDAGIVVTVTW